MEINNNGSSKMPEERIPIPQPGSEEYERARRAMYEALEKKRWDGDLCRYYYITPYGTKWTTPYDFMSLSLEQRRAWNIMVQPAIFYEEGWPIPSWMWGLPPGYKLFQYCDSALNQRYLGGINNLGVLSYQGITVVPELSNLKVSITRSTSDVKEKAVIPGSEITKAQGEEANPTGAQSILSLISPSIAAFSQDVQETVPASRKAASKGVVQERPSGLVLLRDGEEIPLTNFLIAPMEVQIIMAGSSGTKKVLAFCVRNEGESVPLQIQMEDLEKIAAYIQKKVPTCVIYDDTTGATSKIARHVRGLLRQTTHVQIYVKHGWERIQGDWVYIHDGAIPPSPKIRFRTGKTIPCIQGMDARVSCNAAMTLLSLSADPTKSYPVCLYAHLGVMWRLFKEAGYPPHLLLFLNGTTGSLKTATALVAFDLFGTGIGGAGNFRDTETALELKMGDSRDSVMILDDFCPPISRANLQDQEKKLETMVRYYGDGKGKSRGTVALELDREFRPEGLCAITGEDVGGTRSSLLRCVLVSAEKGTYNSELLKRLQDNPRWLSTHFLHFINWVGQNFDVLIQKVRTEFPRYRSVFAERLRERRLADAGAYLKLAGDIFLAYAVACGAIPPQEQTDLMPAIMDALLRVLSESEQSTQTANPVWMYLVALTDGFRRKAFFLAEDRERYLASPEKYIGYCERGRWWLCPNDAYFSVQKDWKQRGRIFPLKQDKLHVALAEAKVSETQVEHRENGDRRVYLVRTTLPSRPRFLVLDPEQVFAVVSAAGQGVAEGAHGLETVVVFYGRNGQEG